MSRLSENTEERRSSSGCQASDSAGWEARSDQELTSLLSKEPSGAGPITYSFLGIKVQPWTKIDLLDVIEATIKSDNYGSIIGNHNLHSLYLTHRDPSMKAFYGNNSFTHVDGMSVIFLARIMGVPLSRLHRNGYLDWIDDFFSLIERNQWRVYFLGGPQEMAHRIPEELHKKFPGLEIQSHHGFDAFSPQTTVWSEIEEFAPQVILVGMGMPLQERWIMEARLKVKTRLFLPCGAILEYVMKVQKPSPRWLGPVGLEWLYRLVTRPRSMYRRYLLEPLNLLPLIVRELMKRTNYGG